MAPLDHPLTYNGPFPPDVAGKGEGASSPSTLTQTLQTRGARYGTFQDNARIAQRLKDVVRSAGKWDEMSHDQREAVDMILSKVSRLTTGDPDYIDNWHDISGYAQLIEERLRG